MKTLVNSEMNNSLGGVAPIVYYVGVGLFAIVPGYIWGRKNNIDCSNQGLNDGGGGHAKSTPWYCY